MKRIIWSLVAAWIVSAAVPALAQQGGLPGFGDDKDPPPTQEPAPSSEPREPDRPAPRTPRPAQTVGSDPSGGARTAPATDADDDEDDAATGGDGHMRRSSSSGSRAASMLATVPEAGKVIALTLDDGYNEDPEVLDLTESLGIRGTAFLVGEIADSDPELVRRLADLGWEVCSHTYSHAVLTGLSESAIAREITRGAEAIERIVGERCPYFRPPQGRVDARVEAVAESLGFTLVGWDSSLSDSTSRDTDPKLQIQIAYQYLRPGSILLGHFGGAHSRIVLHEVLRGMLAAGYRVGTVSELLAAGGRVPPTAADAPAEEPQPEVSVPRTQPVRLAPSASAAARDRGSLPGAMVGAGAVGLTAMATASVRSRRHRYRGLRRLARQLGRQAAIVTRESVSAQR